MKIVFLSFYSGIIPRGVEVFVHNLANRLIDLGNDVIVFQTGPAIARSQYKTHVIPITVNLTKQGLPAAFFNQLRDVVNGGQFTLKVLNAIPSNTDIVIPTNNRLQAIFVRLWALKHKCKMIISGHGGPGLDERIALLTFPDIFVALTSAQRSWALKVNPFIKSALISNGIDLNEFSPQKPPLKIDLPKPIVLCVAAMWPWMKRQHLLIQAMKKVPGVSLLLVGEGEGKNELEQLGNKLLPSRFKIISVPHGQMPNVYSACDLFVYPTSSWESFGIVLLEAMASGLGVVTNNDPIRKEIVGKAGLYVDPENTNQFADRITEGLNNKWKDIPRRQTEKFSWDIIAKKYNDLCEQLLSS